MRSVFSVAVLALLLSFPAPARGEVVLTGVGVEYLETFDSFRGDGFAPSPSAGQLDSDFYRVTGLSDGDTTFGGTFNSGDFARGDSTGGVTSGGVYAFDVGGGDYTLGVQPTGSDFTPGSLTIRVSNQTGVNLRSLRITADALFFNDADRSNSYTFSGALVDDNPFYGDLLTLNSPETADSTPVWSSTPIGGNIDLSLLGGELVNGGDFFIRITGEDLSGGGSRDEFAINNLSVTGFVTVIPEPNSMALLLSLGSIPMVVARRRRP
jgi:hypothetical protein